MAHKAPEKAYREGLSLIEVMDMFPTEDAAREWIESIIWPKGRCCGKCGSTQHTARRVTRRCRTGVRLAGVTSASRPGTPLASSNIPLRKWAITIYLCLTSLKSVSIHEAAPGPEDFAEVRVVHAAPHPGSLDAEGGRRDAL